MFVNSFDMLYVFAMVLLAVRILACLVVLRCKMNDVNTGFKMNNSTTGFKMDYSTTGFKMDNSNTGPKSEVGLSVIMEAKREGAVIPSNVGGWRALCPIAAVAAGLVVTSLAFVAWNKYKNLKKTQKELREELEKLRKDRACAVAECEDLEEEISSKIVKVEELQEENEDLQEQLADTVNVTEDVESLLKEKEDENVYLINQMKEKDRQIQALLAGKEEMEEEQERLKEELRDAANTIEEMERQLEDREHEIADLKNTFTNQMENRDLQIQDVLAEADKMKEAHEILEGKLHLALCDMEIMESVLKKKEDENAELTNHCQTQIENKDHQIQDLLANEEKLKKDNELLEEKLEEACNDMQDLVRTLKKEKEDKTEMTNLYHKMTESRDHQIRDLLAKESGLKEEQEILKEKLGEALCCAKDMERLLKEEQDTKIEMEKRWQQEILEKNQELDMWRQKCEDSDERLRHLEEKMAEALNTEQKLGLTLKEAEDSIMKMGRLMKEKDKEIEKLWLQERDLQEKLQKKEEEYESLSLRGNELQIILNTEKELLKEKEKEVTGLRISIQEVLQEKEQEQESLQGQNDHLQEEVAQLQNSLAIATSNVETLKSELNCAKGEVHHFQMTERKNLQKLQEFAKECELLKEKYRKLEESKEKAEKCASEQQRMQEEALRMQDKYMLMGVLHRIAQRDFELERIMREEHENSETQGEKQEIVSQDHGWETNQEFCCAQNDNRGYLKKQWLDVTDILEDILYRDEGSPEEMEGNSSKNHD